MLPHRMSHGPLPAFIALGSNLGNRAATIERAIDAISRISRTRVVRRSSLIETDPVGKTDQPRFLNGVIEVETALDARCLLQELLEVERLLGRRRGSDERWGPRTIDLDLLMLGNLVVEEPGLVVPHPRMHERRFVLEPLEEIAPRLKHPVLGETIAALLRRHAQSEPAEAR